MSIYMISKVTGCGRPIISRHLSRLVESGLVQRVFYGEIQVFRLNQQKPEVKALVRFFQECGLLR